MKNNLPTIISAFSCILVLICILHIGTLNQELQNTEDRLSNQISFIQDSVDNIYSNIDGHLEAQSNILAHSNWSYGEIDTADKTVVLLCSIAPKEYQPDTTKASLFGNGTEYPMTLVNGEYVVEFPISLFKETVLDTVMFTEGDTIHTQALDWHISPRTDFMPFMYAYFSGSLSPHKKDNFLVEHMDGTIEINIDQLREDNAIQSLSLLTYIDGKETERGDISLNTDSHSEYETSSLWSSSSNSDISYSSETYYHTLDNVFKIPYGSTLELFVEAVDSHGFHYRMQIAYIEVDKKGNVLDDGSEIEWQGMEANIYDEDGNVLYEAY